MKTAPLTRLRNWIEPGITGLISRHGLELGLALVTMTMVGDRSYGLWNLAIMAVAFAVWKAARDARVQAVAGRMLERVWTAAIERQDRKMRARGPEAWVKRFPEVSEGSKTRMLGHVTLKDAAGRILYQIRVTAEPGQFGFAEGRYVIRAFIGVTNVQRPELSRVYKAQFVEMDGRIGAPISLLDAKAPAAIRDFLLTIDLVRDPCVERTYRLNEPKARPALAHDSVQPMIMAIADEAIRREAAAIALELESAGPGELGSLRRRAGRLLHPDATKAAGASAALSAINARIDEVESSKAA